MLAANISVKHHFSYGVFEMQANAKSYSALCMHYGNEVTRYVQNFQCRRPHSSILLEYASDYIRKHSAAECHNLDCISRLWIAVPLSLYRAVRIRTQTVILLQYFCDLHMDHLFSCMLYQSRMGTVYVDFKQPSFRATITIR